MSVNKVILIGNVGNDPEVNYVKEDVPVAKFSLATSESYTNRQGEKVENTEWHNIVIWRGLAKVVEKYVKKGTKLYIEGKLTTRKYEKDGQTKYFTEIVAKEMRMLDRAKDSGGANQSTPAGYENTKANNAPVNDDNSIEDLNEVDDLPF